MKYLRRLSTLAKGKDPVLCINTERSGEALNEDAETAEKRDHLAINLEEPGWAAGEMGGNQEKDKMEYRSKEKL